MDSPAKRPDVHEVRKMFGFLEHPDGDSVLVTNDNIAEYWPRIPKVRQDVLLRGPDPFVVVTWTEPPPEEEKPEPRSQTWPAEVERPAEESAAEEPPAEAPAEEPAEPPAGRRRHHTPRQE